MSTEARVTQMFAAVAAGMTLTVTGTLLTASAQTLTAETPTSPLVRTVPRPDHVRDPAETVTAEGSDAIPPRDKARLERFKAERVGLARAKAEKSLRPRQIPTPTPAQRVRDTTPKSATVAPPPRPRGVRVKSQLVTHSVPFTSTADLTHFQPALDRCRGAVAVNYEPTYDLALILIAEHDYCGGSWVLGLREGQTVKLTGHFAGPYRVARIRDEAKTSANVGALTDLGPIVLQTCSSRTTLRLVGLTRID